MEQKSKKSLVDWCVSYCFDLVSDEEVDGPMVGWICESTGFTSEEVLEEFKRLGYVDTRG